MMHFQQALALAVSEKKITKKKLLAVAYNKLWCHLLLLPCCNIFIRSESKDTSLACSPCWTAASGGDGRAAGGGGRRGRRSGALAAETLEGRGGELAPLL